MANGLQIPDLKRTRGLRIWCNVCRTELNGGICIKNDVPLSKCPNGEHHAFRVVIYEKGSMKRRVKILSTRDIEVAVREAHRFREEVKGNNENTMNQRATGDNRQVPQSKSGLTLIMAMTYYISFLSGKRGAEHTLRVRSPLHCKDIEAGLVIFSQAIKKQGGDMETLLVDEISQEKVGYFHRYLLEDKKYSASSYNRYMSHFRGLYNYLNKYEGVNLQNPFDTVQKKKTIPVVNETIEPEEFKKLLENITRENGIQALSTGEKKYHWHPFLKSAFLMGMLTGLRRESLVTACFNDIEENPDGVPVLLRSDNLKVNRILGITEEDEKRITPVPVTLQLRNLLMQMNYKEHRGSDKYILESNLERKTMAQTPSRSFGQFWKKTNISKDISFKVFRKTYCTKMFSALGDSANAVTGHSGGNQNTLLKHYVDRARIAREIAGNSEIFKDMDEILDAMKEKTRSNEIEAIRAIRKQKNISLGK